MPVSLLFWILMLMWLFFGVGYEFRTANGNYVGVGGNLLLFVLILILGWKVFGFFLVK